MAEGLTREELQARIEYLESLIKDTPAAVQIDLLVKTWGQLIRASDALVAMVGIQAKQLELMEEMLELERSKEGRIAAYTEKYEEHMRHQEDEEE